MKKNLTSLSDFIDQEIGIKGTAKRRDFDKGFEAFRKNILFQQARKDTNLKNGMSNLSR